MLTQGISCRGPLSKWTWLFSSPRYWRVGHPNTIFTNHRFLSPIHLNLRLNWTALPHLISWFPLQCTTHFLSLSEKHLDLSRSSRHHLSAFYGFNHIKSSSTRLSCLIRWTRYTQLYNSRRRWAQPKNGIRQIKSERFIAIYRCLLFDTRRIPGVLIFFFFLFAMSKQVSTEWLLWCVHNGFLLLFRPLSSVRALAEEILTGEFLARWYADVRSIGPHSAVPPRLGPNQICRITLKIPARTKSRLLH